jgi:hypothetical protein
MFVFYTSNKMTRHATALITILYNLYMRRGMRRRRRGATGNGTAPGQSTLSHHVVAPRRFRLSNPDFLHSDVITAAILAAGRVGVRPCRAFQALAASRQLASRIFDLSDGDLARALGPLQVPLLVS